MNENENNMSCGRENDLIAFLYGEQDAAERENFSRHMRDCSACISQFAAFSNIRESVVAWRNASLVSVASGVNQPAAVGAQQKTPSARAAIRGFFDLSPLWMKGAMAFASVLLCVLAVLTAIRQSETPPTAVVTTTSNKSAGSEQEFNALVERRVQEELQRHKATVTMGDSTEINDPSTPDYRSPRRTNAVTSNQVVQSARRPLTKTERQELAADLRLTAGTNESELELLDDRINQ